MDGWRPYCKLKVNDSLKKIIIIKSENCQLILHNCCLGIYWPQKRGIWGFELKFQDEPKRRGLLLNVVISRRRRCIHLGLIFFFISFEFDFWEMFPPFVEVCSVLDTKCFSDVTNPLIVSTSFMDICRVLWVKISLFTNSHDYTKWNRNVLGQSTVLLCALYWTSLWQIVAMYNGMPLLWRRFHYLGVEIALLEWQPETYCHLRDKQLRQFDTQGARM